SGPRPVWVGAEPARAGGVGGLGGAFGGFGGGGRAAGLFRAAAPSLPRAVLPVARSRSLTAGEHADALKISPRQPADVDVWTTGLRHGHNICARRSIAEGREAVIQLLLADEPRQNFGG